MGAEDGAGFPEKALLHPHISVSTLPISEGGVTLNCQRVSSWCGLHL